MDSTTRTLLVNMKLRLQCSLWTKDEPFCPRDKSGMRPSVKLDFADTQQRYMWPRPC